MRTKPDSIETTVAIPPEGIAGDVTVPRAARGLVIFAHGSGSSRFSSRNRFVAGVLQGVSFATLLLDLLTPEEEEVDLQTRHLRFDVELLAERLMQATEWTTNDAALQTLRIGYFGASTGAAAALIAASRMPTAVRAIVSRGGRPDLAGPALHAVQAPTLLLVGGHDDVVIQLNREAAQQLRCENKLEIIPGASHLFEESGTLEQVARLASGWFETYLPEPRNQTR